MLNDSIGRSQSEEHLEFFPEFFLRTILQKRRLTFKERKLQSEHQKISLYMWLGHSLGHEMWRWVTRPIDPSQTNIWNCFQNFSTYHYLDRFPEKRYFFEVLWPLFLSSTSSFFVDSSQLNEFIFFASLRLHCFGSVMTTWPCRRRFDRKQFAPSGDQNNLVFIVV